MKQTTAQKANQQKYVFKIPILNDFCKSSVKEDEGIANEYSNKNNI